MINDVQLEGVLQAFTVQWDIDGAVDGTVSDAPIADGLATTGGVIDRNQQDEEGVYRITQSTTRASIFDLDALGKDAALAERYLQWIRVESGSAAGIPLGFQIFVVFRHPVSGDYIPLQEITAGFVFAGASSFFYLGEIFHIPQGAALMIVGLPEPDPGEVNRVKFSVQAGSSALEDAALHRAMCCDGASGEGEDDPAAFLYRQQFAFSSTEFSVGTGEDGIYVQWSATWNGNDALAVQNSALAIVREDEGAIPIGSQLFVFRARTLNAMVVRTSAPFNARAFAEISVGGGAFVRTFIAAPQLFAAGENIVPVVAFPIPAGALLRVGLLVSTNAVVELNIDLEITTVE